MPLLYIIAPGRVHLGHGLPSSPAPYNVAEASGIPACLSGPMRGLSVLGAHLGLLGAGLVILPGSHFKGMLWYSSFKCSQVRTVSTDRASLFSATY